jgi:hypothetical protein
MGISTNVKKKAIQKLGHTFGDPSFLHVVFQSHTKMRGRRHLDVKPHLDEMKCPHIMYTKFGH